MNRLLLAALSLAGAAQIAHADTTLRCGQVIDTEAGRLLGPHIVVVAGNTIQSISSGDNTDSEQVIDLSDQTCMPGLMDMHTHLSYQLSPTAYLDRTRLNPADYALRAANYADKTLMAGFTTVRDLGDRGNATIALRNAINQGVIKGPRVLTAAKAIGTTGGHADPSNGLMKQLMGDPGPQQGVINSPADARKAVRQRYKDGADLIKITATGGVLSTAKSGQNPQFVAEELAAIIEAANDYGFHVAAHAHGAEGMKRAIRAGVRTIEHGTYMDDEVIRLMRQNDTYYVPTILAGKWVAEKAEVDGFFPAIVRPKAAAIGPLIQETFARAHRAGVKIAFGTDSGVSEHGRNAEEFELMVEAGMPAMAALQSATMTTAELLDQEDQLGSISDGKLADIIAVPGNPIDDISLMRQVSFVMKDGKVYKQP